MINVVCYIIRETYLQKQDDEKKRKNHISDLVRFVVALIDPSSTSSSSTSKTKEETPRVSRQRRKSGDRALYVVFEREVRENSIIYLNSTRTLLSEVSTQKQLTLSLLAFSLSV